jgi:hypothetical protein
MEVGQKDRQQIDSIFPHYPVEFDFGIRRSAFNASASMTRFMQQCSPTATCLSRRLFAR